MKHPTLGKALNRLPGLDRILTQMLIRYDKSCLCIFPWHKSSQCFSLSVTLCLISDVNIADFWLWKILNSFEVSGCSCKIEFSKDDTHSFDNRWVREERRHGLLACKLILIELPCLRKLFITSKRDTGPVEVNTLKCPDMTSFGKKRYWY